MVRRLEARSLLIRRVARGIQACFYFMIPCGGISFLLTLFFGKKTSLKRADDAAKKAEAKAWIESKHAKRKGKVGQEKNVEGPVERVKHEVETELEDAARGEEEAAGVGASENEGLEQGPVGSRE